MENPGKFPSAIRLNDLSENERRKQGNDNGTRHRQNDSDGKPFSRATVFP